MKIAVYDPSPMGNEYCTKMFLAPLRAFARDNGIPCSDLVVLTDVKHCHVVLLTDHLTEERIYRLKENGNKIIGINVTDSSYISGAIRYAKNLQLVDLIFTLSGVQTKNEDVDFRVTPTFDIEQFKKPFLDPDAWAVYDDMRHTGKIQSLPYVPWTPIPDAPRLPWSQRSQKALLRGGGHSRRFILALFLMLKDRLDVNSGFVLAPYFAEDMNPSFKYCNDCRKKFRENGHRSLYRPEEDPKNWDANGCNSPARVYGDKGHIWTLDDLGHWNNRCPRSFFWMAEQFAKRYGAVDMAIVEKMLNARWLHPKEHMEMLGRILFTSDLKWIHSIYAPQRFWEAASAGCINVLPMRSLSQEYFPVIRPIHNFLVFEEHFQNLDLAFSIDEGAYNEMAMDTRQIYDTWIQPTHYAINTNLLTHMVSEMRKA